jgi:hypothetical protein
VTGTGLVIHGARVTISGVRVVSFLDDPRLALKLPEDGRLAPGRHVTGIVLHTTRGDDPQVIKPGLGVSTRAGYDLVDDWSSDHRCAGAHRAIDHDGTVYCLADLADGLADCRECGRPHGGDVRAPGRDVAPGEFPDAVGTPRRLLLCGR